MREWLPARGAGLHEAHRASKRDRMPLRHESRTLELHFRVVQASPPEKSPARGHWTVGVRIGRPGYGLPTIATKRRSRSRNGVRLAFGGITRDISCQSDDTFVAILIDLYVLEPGLVKRLTDEI